MKVEFCSEKEVKIAIKECEGVHVQQIAYSSYHDAFTQICFGCDKVRTSIKPDDTGYSSHNLKQPNNTHQNKTGSRPYGDNNSPCLQTKTDDTQILNKQSEGKNGKR